ncbi:Pleiotropic drug resistance protein 3 [Nymphaea thermarum]|nr:Pleiotropic drug resistance protein 3 [Nymphaea thermarum]
MVMELSEKEKRAGIVPDHDIDMYMKILGLDICSDTLVGDAMRRGISGGQKKRLTTGEMIVGPTKTLFMDEISTGLDSSTTFQIVTYLQQFVHITDATVLTSLLQPAPETFDLFDDIILMAEGKIVYHGPRTLAVQFFEGCGFKCPERKGIADFLQEVISRKDQAQYWCRSDPYSYITVDEFKEKFKASDHGKSLLEELINPSDRTQSHKDAVTFTIYSLSKWEMLKTCMARELLLMKRNSFVYVFKSVQLVIIAFVTMTMFLRTRMNVDLAGGNKLMGSMFYAMVILMVNGFPELSMIVSRLPVFYKHRDFYFYPAWAYTLPSAILKIPHSFVESLVWTGLTYYTIGYSPEAGRFFSQFLLLFAVHQMAASLFRFIASITKTHVASAMAGSCFMLAALVFGGFVIPRSSMPAWLKWGFWVSPLAYAEIGISVNEFLAPRWRKISFGNTTIGQQILLSRGLHFPVYFYWISLGALFGFTILLNLGFTMALTFLKPPGISRAIISRERLTQLQGKEENVHHHIQEDKRRDRPLSWADKMALPFKPLAIAFQDIQYFVDTPQEMRDQGMTEKKLQLLRDITGSFRPGILTALMGVSGAGKTTLMDVLCGRKNEGVIEGDIWIGGYPKVQETFARISGYCEQSDIHSPQITIEESVMFSAWLRLGSEIDQDTKKAFISEVLETIELDGIKDALVGIPGVSGLSTEQRKRLTIAVELVANPSIIFLDEPTSGLDARAAAIVMRAVKNVVRTGRTVICTIHQPSIDIFESFDELMLMKRGGKIIYSGPLGSHSRSVIEYFESISGIPKIKNNYNPATWMLEVTSTSMERRLNVDFAQLYKESSLFQDTQQSLFTILGAMFVGTLMTGINNCSTVLPFVATERIVLYREKFAGMYSSPAYAVAQVAIEIPYVLLQAIIFGTITYAAIGFQRSAYKIFWYFFVKFITLLYYTYLGMLMVSLTPNVQVAAILSSVFYTMLSLFSGFLIPGPQIPKWWIWLYWATPTNWTLRGLFTSQYGDIQKQVAVFGKWQSISSFLKDYFGFQHDQLGAVAAVLLAYPVVFAVLFTYCISKLNFQRR